MPDLEITKNGKTYNIPWDKPTPISDKDIDSFISKQDSHPKEPEKPGFLSDIGNTAVETGKGLIKPFTDYASMMTGNPLPLYQSTQGAIDTTKTNYQKANQLGGVEGAARKLALPLDIAGLPVTQTAEDIIEGRPGKALVHGAMALGGGVGLGHAIPEGRFNLSLRSTPKLPVPEIVNPITREDRLLGPATNPPETGTVPYRNSRYVAPEDVADKPNGRFISNQSGDVVDSDSNYGIPAPVQARMGSGTAGLNPKIPYEFESPKPVYDSTIRRQDRLLPEHVQPPRFIQDNRGLVDTNIYGINGLVDPKKVGITELVTGPTKTTNLRDVTPVSKRQNITGRSRVERNSIFDEYGARSPEDANDLITDDNTSGMGKFRRDTVPPESLGGARGRFVNDLPIPDEVRLVQKTNPNRFVNPVLPKPKLRPVEDIPVANRGRRLTDEELGVTPQPVQSQSAPIQDVPDITQPEIPAEPRTKPLTSDELRNAEVIKQAVAERKAKIAPVKEPLPPIEEAPIETEKTPVEIQPPTFRSKRLQNNSGLIDRLKVKLEDETGAVGSDISADIEKNTKRSQDPREQQVQERESLPPEEEKKARGLFDGLKNERGSVDFSKVFGKKKGDVDYTIKKNPDQMEGGYNIRFDDGRVFRIYHDRSMPKPWMADGIDDSFSGNGFDKEELIGKLRTLDESRPYVDKYSGNRNGTLGEALDRTRKRLGWLGNEKGSIGRDKSPLELENTSAFTDFVNAQKAARYRGGLLRQFHQDIADLGFQGVLDYNAGKREGPLSKAQAFFEQRHKEAVDAGLLKEDQYKENYIHQMWKESPAEVTRVMKNLPKSPSFSKTSVIKDYATGIKAGLTPKYDNLADIMGIYEEKHGQALAAKELYNYLSDTNQVKKLKNGEPVGINNFNKWAYEGPHQEQLGNYAKNVLDTSWKPLKKVADVVSWTKNLYLSGGIPGTQLNKHGFNILNSDFQARGAIKSLKNFFDGTFTPSKDRAFFEENKEIIPKLIEKGYEPGTEGHEINLRAPKDIDEFLQKSKVGQLIHKGIDLSQKLYEDPLFQVHLPATKLRFVLDRIESLKGEGLSEDTAMRQASNDANTVYGGINKALRNKTGNDLMRVGLLAPDWLESRIRFAGKKGASVIRGVAGKSAPGDVMYQKAAARSLATDLVGKGAKLYAGKSLYDIFAKDSTSNVTNLPAGETSDKKKTRNIQGMGTSAQELKIPEELISGLYHNDPAQFLDIVRNNMSLPAQTATNLFKNEDSQGNPLRKTDKFGRPISLKKGAINITNELTNPFKPQLASAILDYGTGKSSFEEAIAKSTELPLQYNFKPSTGKARSRYR